MIISMFINMVYRHPVSWLILTIDRLLVPVPDRHKTFTYRINVTVMQLRHALFRRYVVGKMGSHIILLYMKRELIWKLELNGPAQRLELKVAINFLSSFCI